VLKGRVHVLRGGRMGGVGLDYKVRLLLCDGENHDARRIMRSRDWGTP